jgi:hypothetical protein
MAAAVSDDYSKGSVIVADQQALDGLAGSVVVPMAAVRGQDAEDLIMLPGAGMNCWSRQSVWDRAGSSHRVADR